MFEEIKPEILFCTTEDFTPSLIMAIEEFKPRIVLFGLYYPPNIKPELLCVEQVPQKILENIDISYYNILPTANLLNYNNGHVENKYISDVLYISNTIIEQGNDLLSLLRSVIELPYKLKLCGNQTLPFPQYIGRASLKHLTNMLVATKIVIDFNQNIFMDAAYNKTFCISNNNTNIWPLYNTFDIKDKIEL
ncbi:hypothetical protein LCGC14_3063260, partial [marine sediment metagenome]